jgi:hypothetical protein
MPQPFNYLLNPNNQGLTQSATQPGQVLQNVFALQKQREQEGVQAEKDKTINEMYAKLQTGNASAQDYANLASLMPEAQSKPIRESYALLNEAQQQNLLKDQGQIFSALRSGSPDLASNLMSQMSTAFRNSGNEKDADLFKTLSDLTLSGPDGAKTVETFFGTSMSQIAGGDKIITSAIELGQETRDRQVHQGTLLKMAGELNLTGKQKANAMNTAKEFNQETAQLILQYAGTEAGGDLTPEVTFKFERDLSDDYQKGIKDFNDIEASFNAVSDISGLKTGAGDQALIVLFNKMLDPGSVVRESEAYATMSSTGAAQRFQAAISKLVTGEKLAPQLRKDLVAATTSLMNSARKIEKKHRDRISPAIKNYGLNPENIFGVIEGEEVTTATPELSALQDQIIQWNPNADPNTIKGLTDEEIKASYPGGYDYYQTNIVDTGGTVDTEFEGSDF